MHEGTRTRPQPPRGAWPSPLAAGEVAAGTLRLAQPRLDRGRLHWLEGRPSEGGRGVVMRVRTDGLGAAEEASPGGRSIRSRVHEYGGGDYLAADGELFVVDDGDGAIHRAEAGGWRCVAGCIPGARYADLALAPDHCWLVAVEETAREGDEPENRLVALSLREASRRVLVGDHDFVSSPTFARDGGRLACLAWNHPAMPWQETRLLELRFGSEGPVAGVREVAGGRGESIFQPRYSPAGRLTFASDRTGFWNLYQASGGAAVPLGARRADFGRPQWVLGLSSYDFADENLLLCVVTEDGVDRLVRLDATTGRLDPLPLPLTAIEGVRVEGRWACLLGAGPRQPLAVFLLSLADGALRETRSSLSVRLDAGCVSEPEAMSFPSDGGLAHAFLYRPRQAGVVPRPGERPPLLVRCHGGPTSAAQAVLDLGVQYWTTRGFAVVDVNYAGSAGYGRAYRERLQGAWGVADVADCVAAARFLVREAGVDPGKLVVRGGSAGGYTTLCVLAFTDVFSAGGVYYGIGDLEALARETHKFEKHYLDGLIGPYPERRDLYRERSPLTAPERLTRPVIIFQGLDDRVVPPSQAEALVAALAQNGVPHEYLVFPGEGHGFRRAETIERALAAELRFYQRVFGIQRA